MLKHIPKYFNQPTHSQQNMAEVKQNMAAQQNQINLGKILFSIAMNGELAPFLYYSQIYLTALSNQLLDLQYHFILCMRDDVSRWVLYALLHLRILSST